MYSKTCKEIIEFKPSGKKNFFIMHLVTMTTEAKTYRPLKYIIIFFYRSNRRSFDIRKRKN